VRILLLDGNENQAVAAVRSLGRAGHEIQVGAEDRWSKAGWSRHAAGTFVYPSPRRDATAFVDALVDRIAREPGTFVLPLTESSTLPVSAQRQRLYNGGARLVLPAHDAVLRAFDKDVTQRVAESLGIDTPRTRVVDSIANAKRAAAELGYPVVIKPRTSEERGPSGESRAAGAPSYAGSPDSLVRAFDSMRERSSSMLLQEWVPGGGAGYFALLNRGELRAEFAHRRIRDVRPTGSGSALRQSVPVQPVLRDASLAILRALEWHGVAMVEFRMRPDGTPVFLEVNGRFWNSLALAVYAGADFPRLLADMAETGDCETRLEYRIGVRCRWLLGDVRHLAAVFAGPPADFPGRYPGRLRTLLALLRPVPGTLHDNFTLDDPRPEFGDWLHFLGRRVPHALVRRPRRTG
jgi:predicted ATP-grasp superfamily ATP-dependent carboligase